VAELKILLFIVFPVACYWFALHSQRPAALRGRIRARGWGLLLPVLGLMFAALAGQRYSLVVAEVVSSCLIMLFAPRVAARLVPYLLLVLAVFGLYLFDQYHQAFFNNSYQYGLVLAGADSWRTHLVLPQAMLFFAAGGWLLLRIDAPGAGLVRRVARYWWQQRARGVWRGQEVLLLPVVLLGILLLGVHGWVSASVVVDLLATVGAFLLMFRSRLWAATVATAGLLVLGGYGFVLAVTWPNMPGWQYGFVQLTTPGTSLRGCVIQGALLLAAGLWLVPGVMGEHLGTPTEILERRVRTLTQTRTDAVDTAAAELRRIERDLHDGAQARLVALGMSLQAAEKLFLTSPEAALALVSEAKEASSQALTELRDLVRGIYPPVLADRGLADAIRSLAMDSPLNTTVDIDLPGDVEMPVGSAVYFAVAEALTNAARHADADVIRVEVSHGGGVLRASVIDDGAGGADPERGTGLIGIERRLATFDGILAVSSPHGGPTIVAIEVPCALSSGKTSSC
jgi:signal transduction histidine kinase